MHRCHTNEALFMIFRFGDNLIVSEPSWSKKTLGDIVLYIRRYELI